jgi:chromosome segregation ATPase
MQLLADAATDKGNGWVWGTIGGMLMAALVALYNYTPRLNKKMRELQQKIESDNTEIIRKAIEDRDSKINEYTKEVARLQGQVTAITELYTSALMSLQGQLAENRVLRDKVTELTRRNDQQVAQMAEQERRLQEQDATILRLSNRITGLENSGSPVVSVLSNPVA